MRTLRSGLPRSCFGALVLVASLQSQCALQWLPGAPYAGANDGVTAATRWDPDGPGPGGELLAVAGWFRVIGTVRANSVAAYDPATGQWAALGEGTNGPVHTLLALPNGDLVAGGQFSVAGGGSASQIARWNGTTWAPIGTGLPVGAGGFGVRALASLPNGDLVAGGAFAAPGGTLSIARWNGSAGSARGGGVGGTSQASVFALCARTNGDLIAGGQFSSAGGAAVANIARWNGTTWSPLAMGVDGSVLALRELANGDLAVGGRFDNAGGAPAQRIATWNGSTWSPLGGGVTAALGQGVFAFTTLPNGDLVAGGVFRRCWRRGRERHRALERRRLVAARHRIRPGARRRLRARDAAQRRPRRRWQFRQRRRCLGP